MAREEIFSTDHEGEVFTSQGEYVLPLQESRHVLLLEDWGTHRAGSVVLLDDDTKSMLDAEHVPYRDASEFERRIAGFTD
jgi:hypothetical protein